MLAAVPTTSSPRASTCDRTGAGAGAPRSWLSRRSPPAGRPAAPGSTSHVQLVAWHDSFRSRGRPVRRPPRPGAPEGSVTAYVRLPWTKPAVLQVRLGGDPAEELDQPGDEAGPAGLVAGADPGAVVAVEVLVEQDVVSPVGIVWKVSTRRTRPRPEASRRKIRASRLAISRRPRRGHLVARAGRHSTRKLSP